MTPILSTYAWPVFDDGGHLVALFATEIDARAWAEARPWFCGKCPYMNTGFVCTKCGATADDRVKSHDHTVGHLLSVIAKERT